MDLVAGRAINLPEVNYGFEYRFDALNLLYKHRMLITRRIPRYYNFLTWDNVLPPVMASQDSNTSSAAKLLEVGRLFCARKCFFSLSISKNRCKTTL